MGPAPLFVYSLRYDKIVRLDVAMTRNSPLFESPARLIAIGCVLLLAAAAILAIVQRQALLAELEQESAALHRLASQRADQHDAHLTASRLSPWRRKARAAICSSRWRRPSRGSIRASIGAKLGTTSQAEMTRLWLEGREVP